MDFASARGGGSDVHAHPYGVEASDPDMTLEARRGGDLQDVQYDNESSSRDLEAAEAEDSENSLGEAEGFEDRDVGTSVEESAESARRRAA